MACGCGGKGQRNITRGGRPVISPSQPTVSIQGGLKAVNTPGELRQLAMQKTPNRAGSTAEQRQADAKRRDAIRRSLGKG